MGAYQFVPFSRLFNTSRPRYQSLENTEIGRIIQEYPIFGLISSSLHGVAFRAEAGDHHHLMRPDGGHDVVPAAGDGQFRRMRDAWHLQPAVCAVRTQAWAWASSRSRMASCAAAWRSSRSNRTRREPSRTQFLEHPPWQ